MRAVGESLARLNLGEKATRRLFVAILVLLAVMGVDWTGRAQPSSPLSPPMFVFSITPASGPTIGGTPITIAYTGAPLGPILSVTIDGLPLQNASYGNVATGTTPPGSVGPKDVVVHYSSLTLALVETQPGGFTYGPSTTCTTVLIAEDFGGSGLPDSAVWDAYSNGGTLDQAGGVLVMRGATSQFPYVRAQAGVLPPLQDNWTLEVRMRWPFTSIHGVGMVTGMPAINNAGPQCFSAWYHQPLAQAWRDAGAAAGTNVTFGGVWQSVGVFDASLRTFTWVASAGVIRFYLDGQYVNQGPNLGLTMETLWFGNPCVGAGSMSWCQLDIDYVTLVADFVPSTYCTAGTTSNGCVPQISGSGQPSASAASGFTIAANAVEGQKSGLILYGVTGRLAAPWFGGSSYLCVKSPAQRTGTLNSGGTAGSCDGVMSIDWNAYMSSHPNALGQPLQVGQVVNAQAWFRDPAAPGETNLSNGLEFTVCP
mgnify:CR=1 FL=1